MSETTVIWSMCAAAGLTLAIAHGLVWWTRKDARAHGLFALSAVGASSYALFEMGIMHSSSPAESAELIRWGHISAWLMIVSLVGFVRVYLHAGRSWLAWSVIGLRTIALGLNFFTGANLNYREITALKPISFLGDAVVLPVGAPNPLMLVAQAGLLLLIIFVADAMVTVWCRGEKRRAIRVGGSLLVFTLGGSLVSVLALWGVVAWPLSASPFYFGIIVAMSYELSREVLRAADLSKELQESQRRMALAAEVAHLGVWVRDLAKNEIWATNEWRALFGFGPSEPLTLERIAERIYPQDREIFERILQQAQEGGGAYEMEYRLTLPDGRVRWIASRGRVEFREPGGPPVLARGTSMDVTQRKETERQAQRQREEIAHLSRVAMLGELSGSLAHELNQPLTAILSNAQAAQRFLARDSFDREELQEILGDIVEADKRAGEVIRSLRALFKKGEATRSPLHIAEIVRGVLKLVQSDALNHGVFVSAELDEGLPVVTGDAVQLQQVLLNLILNAIDALAANAEGQRFLFVTAGKSPGGGVEVVVRDTGPGVPAEIQAQIFDPFFTTKSQGLGLGLVISRSILEAHGSALQLRGVPEGGAEFSFTLPVPEEGV